MPKLAVIQKKENGKINIFFSDYLIQSDNPNVAVMAYDKVTRDFINDPISQGITDKERYLFYEPDNPLFLEFFGEFMPGYVQTLNNLGTPAKPSRYIGISKDVGKDEYRRYAEQLPIPPLEKVLEEDQV